MNNSKIKYTLEYDMMSVPVMLLWNQISTAPGLSQWFADKVTLKDHNFRFTWKGSSSDAEIIASRSGNYIRYRWKDNDDDDKSYFELKIASSEITSNTTLIITDFADDDSDLSEGKELWNYQIENLKRILGCL